MFGILLLIAAACTPTGGGTGTTTTTADSGPPIAVASASPTIGDAPYTVYFDSTGSIPGTGVGLTYAWDFGDGTPTGRQSVDLARLRHRRNGSTVRRSVNIS